ncbi:MAG: CDP-glucose 4,6-dehydratase [Spirochaetae bacterium HGW-Spirochaetae-5]|jgi:CDP-glucose 4,6-dehydratase|nr:MAG: CDP-glucose 4,6-dehydratase [Spirochaetae bacterium HGW-Spirochaetae-5]
MTERNFFSGIYKGKNVLITGHTGFKGSWLALWLKELGATVYGYALEPNTDPSLFKVLDLEKKIDRHIVGDIRDCAGLVSIFNKFRPEIVFHLAAQPLVRLSYREPVHTYETNVMGTVHVLDAARLCKTVKSMVIITSDKCYENREWVYGYRENEAMGGYDPYSSSKGCSELVTAAYRNSFFNTHEYGKSHGTAVASARAGNVIGGGDWAEDRLVPDCIRAFSIGEALEIRSPFAVRPWQHVLEPLSGYLWLGAMLYEKGCVYADGWNFGPEDSSVVCVEEIIKDMISLWGGGEYEITSDTQPHEARLLKLDVSKARYHINWHPVYDIKETLRATVQWYRAFYDGIDRMYDYTINQIQAYADAAREAGLPWSR